MISFETYYLFSDTSSCSIILKNWQVTLKFTAQIHKYLKVFQISVIYSYKPVVRELSPTQHSRAIWRTPPSIRDTTMEVLSWVSVAGLEGGDIRIQAAWKTEKDSLVILTSTQLTTIALFRIIISEKIPIWFAF